MENPSSRPSWIAYLFGLIAVCAVALGIKTSLAPKTSETTPTPTPSQDTSSAPSREVLTPSSTQATSSTSAPVSAQTMPSASHSTYKNGTYEAMGNYTSPGGDEQIDITLTLAFDTITDASAAPQATGGISLKMQQSFTDNFKPLVVGKKLDEVSLTKVARSSLTPTGFNDAVAQIKLKAKS